MDDGAHDRLRPGLEAQRPPTDSDFVDFVTVNEQRLLRRAYLLTTSAASAEDLVQTALVTAYVKWDRVARADNPIAYVDTILLRAFLTGRRRRSSQELPAADAGDTLRSVAGRDDHSRSTTERIAVLAAVRELTEKERAVVVLRFYDDLNVAQTARLLGVSETTVKSRTHRALRRLRGVLDPTDDAEPSDGPADSRNALTPANTSRKDWA